jgi:hypothetical protein
MLFTTESFLQADAQYRRQRISSDFLRGARRGRRLRSAAEATSPAPSTAPMIPQPRSTECSDVSVVSR